MAKDDKSIIVETPTGPRFVRLLALRGALTLELKGMRRSHGRSVYAIVKSEFGFKGSKAKVLAQLERMIEQIQEARDGQA